MSAHSGRRRTTDRHYSAEDQALDQISKEAEERLQAKRQARAEAREIRMREIERQQKEEEEKQKTQQQGVGDTPKSISSYSGSRRGSDESDGSEVSSNLSQDPKDYIRELRSQLRELEEKYKHAMVTNAQLDNTKTTHVFQIELLKEKLEEQEETMIEVQREYKDKNRDYELLKRDFKNLQLDCDSLKQQMEIKDRLLQESGLVIISNEEGQFSLSKCSDLSDISIPSSGTALISQESAEVLQKAGEGTLGKSDKVKIPVSNPNVVIDDVDSVRGTQGESLTVSDGPVSEQNGMNSAVQSAYDKIEAKSDSKEQSVEQAAVDNSLIESKNNVANIKDANSNDIKQETGLTESTENTNIEQKPETYSNTEQTGNELKTVDSGIKIELDLLTDDQVTNETATDSAGTYGLSKSMVARLEKMTEGAEYKQGLCTSISFESDVTYHRESEDELLDNEDNSDTNLPEKVCNIENRGERVGSIEVAGDSNGVVKSVAVDGSGDKAKFQIGDANDSEVIADQYVKHKNTLAAEGVTDKFVNEYGFQADREINNLMIPNESVDDVSSMLVDYDQNETVSIEDYVDDRFEEFESNADSGEEESAGASGEPWSPKAYTLANNSGLVGPYGQGMVDPSRFLNATQSFDDVSSMMVEYDPSETVSVGDNTEDMFEDAVDNTEMTVANVEKKDYVPGNMRTIDYWVRSVSREEVIDIVQDIESSNDTGTAKEEQISVTDSLLTSQQMAADEDFQTSQLEEFAKNYVKDIVYHAIEVVNSDPDSCLVKARDSAEVAKQVIEKTGSKFSESEQKLVNERLNTSTSPKASFSDVVLPLQRPSESSSVILSPITHVSEETSHGGVEFFSYKLQTQASVVLESTGKGSSEEVCLQERDEDTCPSLSDISGYGVCLSGEGLEEMEKYYKEMCALSESEKQKGITEESEMVWSTAVADHNVQFVSMAGPASPTCDEVFFAASEHQEGSSSPDEKKAGESSEPKVGKAEEENSNKIATSDVGSHSIVDDWAKKDYEAAAGHNSLENIDDLKNISDDLGGEISSSHAKETEKEQQELESEGSHLDAASEKERSLSASPGSEAVSKRKKGKKSKSSTTGEEKRSSAEARSSASDVDKRSSGSVHGGEGDHDKTGKKGSHSKRKDDKLKRLLEERNKLQDEIKRLESALEEEKTKEKPSSNKTPQMNGPEMQLYEVQREASKQIHEYKLKLQKAEQEITNLDGTVVRLETQVKRFKYDADEAEKLEDELKTDRRRLQRELRECQNQIEELTNQNKHLNKRLEKIRQSRSALVNQ